MAYKINPITGKMDLVGGNSNSESDSGLSSEEVQELITENLDNPENLVTEDENGIARAIDKKVTDKSMINSVILSAQFDSAASASDKLVEASNGFYAPVHGQTMHWVDLNSELHLSRYSEALGVSGLDKKPLCWLGGATNDKVVVLNGVNSQSTDVGGMVYAISADGIHWKYGVATNTVERWYPIQYGGGLFIANTGNSSKEYIIGRLQGPNQDSISWSVYSNMPGAYHSVMYYCDDAWLVCTNSGGTSYTYDIYIFDPDNGTFSLLTTVNRGNVQNDISKNQLKIYDGKLYVSDSFGVDIIDLQTMTVLSTFATSNREIFETIKFKDSIYLYGRIQGNSVYKITDDGLQNLVAIYPRKTNIIEHNGYLFWLGSLENDKSNLIYTGSFSKETTKEQNGTEFDTNNPVQLLPFGDDILVISGFYRYFSAENSDFVYNVRANSLRASSPTINNVNRWEEIPILSTGNDVLLMRRDNQFKAVQLHQLKMEDETLSVDSSDEYLAPVGYKCTPLSPSNPILYCPEKLENITVGSSEVFTDSQCMYYFGYITNKTFNPNNPTEIEVTLWQNGQEIQLYYVISDNLYPNTIATSRAVMELSKKIAPANYVYPVYLGIEGWEDQKLYELCGNVYLDLEAGSHAEVLCDLENLDLSTLPNFEIDEGYPYYDFQILNFSGTYTDNGARRQICEDREEDGTFVAMKSEGNQLLLSYNKTESSYINVYFQCRFMIMPHRPV